MVSREFSVSADETPLLEAPVGLFPEERTHVGDRRLDFVARNLRQRLTNARTPGFLLMQEEFPVLQGNPDVRAAFIPDTSDLLTATRRSSKHGVQFGQLVLWSSDVRQRVELVAAKQLDTPARAANEFGASKAVNAIDFGEGRPRAFKPLGFYIDPEARKTFLFTRHEHHVLTLDNVMWDDEFTPTDTQMRTAIGQCALYLGGLHRNGIAHGDAVAKNIASDNKGIRVVDLEYAERLWASQGCPDPLRAAGLFKADITDCLSSLHPAAKPYLGDFLPQYLEEVTGIEEYIHPSLLATRSLIDFITPHRQGRV